MIGFLGFDAVVFGEIGQRVGKRGGSFLLRGGGLFCNLAWGGMMDGEFLGEKFGDVFHHFRL